MPLFDIKCNGCNAITEVFCDYDELKIMECLRCGDAVTRLISTFSRHGSWSGKYAGYHDRGLGCYVESYQHRQQLMKEKGLRPVSSEELDRGMEATIAASQNHDTTIKKLFGE